MLRVAAIAALGLLLTSCAIAPPSAGVASLTHLSLSPELECMTECLDEADQTCESCAASCLAGGSAELISLR